jgi:HD-like signal output (HDOD) protein
MQKQSGRPAVECESELLGVTHPELSLAVLEKWQLPVPIRSAVRHHHAPEENAAGPGLLSLSRAVQLADQAINGLGITLLPTDKPPVDPTPLLEQAGLKNKAERVIDSFQKDFSAMKAGI